MQQSRVSLERLQQIQHHLAPQSEYRQTVFVPCSAENKNDDLYFPDEDESTYVYKDIPQEDKFPVEVDLAGALSRTKKFKLASGKQVVVGFRTYVEGEDDEAFQRLDSVCAQGATGLETVFFLKEKWSSFQRKTECIVAYPIDDPKRIVATSRGHRKWVFLNGKRVPITYHFLLRVDPEYRGCGVGHYTERYLLYNDYEQGVRYVQGYVVPDNEKSLALQKRFTDENSSDITELMRWFVSGYSPNKLIEKLNTLPAFDFSNLEVRHTSAVREQVEHTKKHFGNTQLIPCDLSNIFRSKLSEGTYFVHEKGSDQPIASFSVWNSGAVRSSKLPGMKDFLRNPCIFYNCWFDASLGTKGSNALAHLIKTIARQLLESTAHEYIYVFLVEDHPLAEFLKESAKFFVAWKARLWYWDSAFMHDPSTGCVTFFDPRDSLQ